MAEEKIVDESKNPMLSYITSIFAVENIRSFYDNLTKEQQDYISAFVSGYQVALKRKIVGIYDVDYIKGFHLTPELLESLSIYITDIDVEHLKMKFSIVVQLLDPIENTEKTVTSDDGAISVSVKTEYPKEETTEQVEEVKNDEVKE